MSHHSVHTLLIDQNGNQSTAVLDHATVRGLITGDVALPSLPADEGLDPARCYRLHVFVG